MEYMLLLYINEARWPSLTKAEQEQGFAAYMAYREELKQAGVFKGSSRLQPTSTAKTVRLKDAKPLILDGPYAESKEQLGGYFMIDAPDLETALSWAERCPTAGHGVVEVRQLG